MSRFRLAASLAAEEERNFSGDMGSRSEHDDGDEDEEMMLVSIP